MTSGTEARPPAPDGAPYLDAARFYDDIAEHYHLIFPDWEASMARQASGISAMIEAAGLGPDRRRLLDVAAGIGTQSLPLAGLGYDVTARDVSHEAIARLAREASARGLVVDAATSDMRTVEESVEGPFDVVIAFDNSVPHLLDDDEILGAFQGFRRLLAPGGLLLVSVRDYEHVDRSPTSHHGYGERSRAGRTFRLAQNWKWLDATHYRTTMVVEERLADTWRELVRTDATYYAVSVARLMELMSQAGFESTEVSSVPFYQPVLSGRRMDDPT